MTGLCQLTSDEGGRVSPEDMQRLKDEAIVVLALLVDPEPCDHFDHHGDCQTHGTGATRPCPHARAKALLAELVQRADEHTEVCR